MYEWKQLHIWSYPDTTGGSDLWTKIFKNVANVASLYLTDFQYRSLFKWRSFKELYTCSTSFQIWLFYLKILLYLSRRYVEAAVMAPPWANPKLNPCASQPRGWQLLFWPPDGKCYKIFQVRKFYKPRVTCLIILLKQLNNLCNSYRHFLPS